MNGENSPSPELNPADIAACAHMIWEKEGKPCGRDVEHWLQAETLLRAMRAAEADGDKAPAAAPPTENFAPSPRKRQTRRAARQAPNRAAKQPGQPGSL